MQYCYYLLMSFLKLSPELIRQHKGISFTGITTAFLCYDGDGKILLTKRSKNTRDEHGRWDAGGGGLKHGESLENNLTREIIEEYNAKPLKIDFLGYLDAFRETADGVPTHWLAMYFAVRINPAAVKINEPDMVDDYGWYSLDDLPSPMHSQFGKFYTQHGAKLRELMAAQ